MRDGGKQQKRCATHHQFKCEGQNRGKMTGGAAHLIGTGRGRVAQEQPARSGARKTPVGQACVEVGV
jgi:hypothetical protein